MGTDVGAVFNGYPPAQRTALLRLRRLILETAVEANVGDLVETLKWGQPAFLTVRPRTGTTIRIDAIKGSSERYAMYVNCRTTLVDSYRLLYPDAFEYEGQRAVIFSTGSPPPDAALRHCIALALTYHRPKA
jgi:hypothetical protein